jgi:hypothetical protein
MKMSQLFIKGEYATVRLLPDYAEGFFWTLKELKKTASRLFGGGTGLQMF